MAYIQITTRCNMECAHCCDSCTARGKDMAVRTFRAALKWAGEFGDEYIAIGGGEPTIHPRFWEFIGLALGGCENVWLATNGKKTEIALALARLARRGVLAVALSQDDFHEEINPKVIEAFKAGKKPYPTHFEECNHDLREVRDVSQHIIAAGRGKDLSDNEQCPCPDLFVNPAGDIRACGCEDAPTFGSVLDPGGIYIPEDWELGECWKEQPGRKEAARG